MDLEVLKALGDETRYAMYRELAGVDRARCGAGTSPTRLGLHANTVRLHLERLRDAGLVDVEAIHRGTVGRPQHRYSLAPGAPGARLRPARARAARRPARRAGRDVGRRRRRRRASTGRAVGRPRRPRAHPARRSCLTALAQRARPPRLRARGGPGDGAARRRGTRIEFLHCPFRELAEAYPELVCNLHRGICEGVADSRPRNSGASSRRCTTRTRATSWSRYPDRPPETNGVIR